IEAVVRNLYSDAMSVHTTRDSSWSEVLNALGHNFNIYEDDKLQQDTDGTPKLFLISGNQVVDTVRNIKLSYPRSIIIVDASETFASEAIDWKSLQIDGCVIVPERSLGGIPGLSIVAIRREIVDANRIGSDVSYIFDLNKYFISSLKNDSPFSPDISAAVALCAAIELIEHNGGIKEHTERQKSAAEIFYEYCSSIGEVDFHDNRVTRCTLPEDKKIVEVLSKLNTENISLGESNVETNTLCFGHIGHLESADINILFKEINTILGISVNLPNIPTTSLLVPDSFFEGNDLFEISSEEFYSQAIAKADLLVNEVSHEKVVVSAQKLFLDPFPIDSFSFRDRTLGFIGAGRTVKETVKRCLSVGVKNIIVFSPSLSDKISKGIQDEETLYWENLGVLVSTTTEDVFLQSHTVVLLPTYYDSWGAALFGQDPSYVNTNLICDSLLTHIEKSGKMDLLINASARPLIIDREALTKHLNKGWLRYISDETPNAKDPVTYHKESYMTGHVGGSAKQTKNKIAQNTRLVLEQIISEYTSQTYNSSSYKINLTNKHLCPPGGWRMTKTNPKNENPPNLRILLTDIFDVDEINFLSLGERFGVNIELFNKSSLSDSESEIIKAIHESRPHIMMIRTKTTISDIIAQEIVNIPNFICLIRPGVGLENIYQGMETLSANGIKIINEPFGNSSAVGEMATRFVMRGVPKVILTPGPTPYNHDVFNAIKEYSHPKTESFKDTLNYISENLRSSWLQLPYGSIISSSPSTGLMEAAILNLTTMEEFGFVLSHGKFGNRFIDICAQNKRSISYLQVEDSHWGEAFTIAAISSKIRSIENEGKKISFFCLQQNETSSGVALSQSKLKELVNTIRGHNNDCLIILDAVSGLFAHELDFSDIDVDMVITGSQKGLGVSSGLSYAVFSKRALEKMLNLAEYASTVEQFFNDNDVNKNLKIFEKKQQVFYYSLLRLLLRKHPFGYSVFHITATARSL
ncbi:MAG: hypothetical protein RJA61_401, partial [Candidatus Parcubacteria bacterium]